MKFLLLSFLLTLSACGGGPSHDCPTGQHYNPEKHMCVLND